MDEEEEFLAMKEFNEDFDDMPDGAFFAMAEEMYGWDVYDWAWFAEKSEKYNKIEDEKLSKTQQKEK